MCVWVSIFVLCLKKGLALIGFQAARCRSSSIHEVAAFGCLLFAAANCILRYGIENIQQFFFNGNLMHGN
jgi:hypothetical protein